MNFLSHLFSSHIFVFQFLYLPACSFRTMFYFFLIFFLLYSPCCRSFMCVFLFETCACILSICNNVKRRIVKLCLLSYLVVFCVACLLSLLSRTPCVYILLLRHSRSLGDLPTQQRPWIYLKGKIKLAIFLVYLCPPLPHLLSGLCVVFHLWDRQPQIGCIRERDWILMCFVDIVICLCRLCSSCPLFILISDVSSCVGSACRPRDW